MAILLETQNPVDDTWEYEGLYGHPDDEIVLTPPSGSAQFDEFIVNVDESAESLVVWAKLGRQEVKLRQLRPQDNWSCSIFDQNTDSGRSRVRVTNIDVSDLPLFECPLCHELVRPFEVRHHGESHNQAELVQGSVSHEEFWVQLLASFTDYIEESGIQGYVMLGLSALAEDIDDRIGEAELYDCSLRN